MGLSAGGYRHAYDHACVAAVVAAGALLQVVKGILGGAGMQGVAPLPPSLRVGVSAAHSEADLEHGASAIRRAAAAILKPGGKS